MIIPIFENAKAIDGINVATLRLVGPNDAAGAL
jgi:hypothetical protein